MLSFKSYLTESEIKPLHNLLNTGQMKALRKSQDFHYIGGMPGSKIYAKHGSRHSSAVHHFIIANSDQKHRMDIAMTPRGKILNYEIHRKTDEGWGFVKGVEGKD